jgi:predicted phage terminase large subunit-like protein
MTRQYLSTTVNTDKVAVLDALLRQRLSYFTRRTFATVDPGAIYLHNWHIDLIAEYLTACTYGQITRLLINMPPRYLKSISVSVAWPAWLLGHNPSAKILASSYSDKLSLKHSVDCRLVVQSDWYRRVFPGVVLTPDQNEKSKFVTTARGHRIATSTRGTATGEGGDYLIVDDAHDPRRAESPTERNNTIDWYDQTYSTRLNDKIKGVIVAVMQRLHYQDLSQHLIDQGGWTHLVLPAVAEVKTIIDYGRVHKVREVGDILHPEREGQAELERARKTLRTYGYAGQYQQAPVPRDGGMIKTQWVKRYGTAPARPIRVVQSWDTAYKPGQLNDPSVCTTWAETANGYYLLDVWRDRVEYPALKRAVLSLADKYKPAAILIEDKASGQSLIQDIKSTTRLPVIAITPVADKLTRMSTQSPQIESGLVYLPESADWLVDYETELYTFPLSAHDDQVDSTSQYLCWTTKGKQLYEYTPVTQSTTRGAW